MPIESYHMAWLSTHPNRSLEWLQERMKDGFDVHHLDGDHENDDPGNLVLIDCLDHMRLHGTSWNRIVRNPLRKRRTPPASCTSFVKHKTTESSVRFPSKQFRPVLGCHAVQGVRVISFSESDRKKANAHIVVSKRWVGFVQKHSNRRVAYQTTTTRIPIQR